MKFIQTLISDGMSMNSLKPSINTEAESSLDSCIMKETPVEDCLLSKELNSQNNGDKELCLTDYDVGGVENTAKKMFEQVDLNSSMPNSEVPLKKDSWNSEALCDNSSEKENMETNDVSYDILSDEDDNESIHLKISSDDENSVIDSEINEPSSNCNKQLDNSNENLSQDVTEDAENPDSPCDVHSDLQNESNCAMPSGEEVSINFTSEKGVSLDGYAIEGIPISGEGRIPVSDSEHEDTTEDFEPIPCSSESPKQNLNDSVRSDVMVNEAKSIPTSHENSHNAEKGCDILDANFENEKGEKTATEEVVVLPNDPQDKSKQGSSIHSSTEGSEISVPLDCTSEAVKLPSKNDKEEHLSAVSGAGDSAQQDLGKEAILVSDDAIDSDSCVDNLQENDVKIIDSPKTDKASNKHNEEEQIPNRALETLDSDPKEDESSVSSELDETAKEGTLLNESSPQSDIKSLERVSPLKESTDSEKSFEILEYQPANEEGEELKEIQSDKEIPGDEIEQRTLSDDIKEHLEQSVLHTEKELETHNSPSIELKDSECSSPKSNAIASPFNSPDTKSSHAEIANDVSKEQDDDIEPGDDSDNDKEECVERERKVLRNSCNKVTGRKELDADFVLTEMTLTPISRNKVTGTKEVDDDDGGDDDDDDVVECVSEVASAGKESLPQSSGAQPGRKRTSSNEENLVNCSKRTKVAVFESDNEASDVLMNELPTDSDSRTKCTEADTKEKCDSRTKRLSDSIDDIVELKKIRVMPEVSLSKKDEKSDKVNSSENLECKKNSEKHAETNKASNVEKYPMPFLRALDTAQFRNMSRNELEELVLKNLCDAVAERTTCGELRERSQSLEEKVKAWQKKCGQLNKQIRDLNVVLKRYGSDLQSKGASASPVRITRSVGLQVQMPGIPSSSWNPEESAKRKSEKTPPPTPTPTSTVSAPVTTSAKATSPVPKPVSSVQKVSDGSDVQVTTASTRPNIQSTTQASGVKALPAKSPTSSPVAERKSGKPQSSVNRVKSDLQVIDLTDGEDKNKNNTTRSPVVSSSPATSVSVPNVSTTVTSSVSNTTVTTVGIPANRSIRVVQQLGTSNTPILAQGAANAVTGQRVAYFVPSTSVPVQQRQLIISSPSQVRPAGVVSMSQRQNPLPTIVLKPSQNLVPVSPVTGGNIIRTSNIGSSLQLSPRVQPRTGQLIQRIPVNTSAVQSTGLSVVQSSGLMSSSKSHPAPLPPVPSGPSNANWKLPPPKPDLKISKVPNRNQQGIVLSWNMTVSNEHEQIASYQLFAYQEGNAPPSTHLWKKVGDVTALPLPMACTLTQFMEGHKYHFAVRAVDVFARCGPFSAPGNIVLSRH